MYQALYRKYRPKKFSDVFGQDAIVKILKNALQTQQITHAYLFSGPRGTGKTTIAKIFARAVNCSSIKDGESCEKCESCQNSFSKECIDIIEIDAASNNGVDEIRELKSKVNILPAELKYKVYIIDEVHMLSIGAFNALLKTLEEPPEHVIFILATTDPQKVPITITSRCQCFQFKRISDTSMLARLKQIAELEKFEIEEDVLDAIVSCAGGGLRDAIGLLDKITSYKTGLITLTDFYEIQGILIENEIKQFVDAIFTNDPKKVLQLVENFLNNGKDLLQIMHQLLQWVKKQLVLYYTESQKLEYEEQKLILFANEINKQMYEIKKVEDTRTYVEVFLLSFMYNQIKVPIVAPPKKEEKEDNKKQEKVEKIEETKKTEQEEPVTIQKNIEKKIDYSFQLEQMRQEAHNVLATASKIELLQIKEQWKKLSDFTFDSNIGYVVCYLMDGTLCTANEQTFILSYEYDSMLEKILEKKAMLEDVFAKITGLKRNIVLITKEQWMQMKNEFIQCKQAGVPFEKIEIKEETKQISKSKEVEIKKIEKTQDDDTLALFGEIVEIK